MNIQAALFHVMNFNEDRKVKKTLELQIHVIFTITVDIIINYNVFNILASLHQQVNPEANAPAMIVIFVLVCENSQ